MPSKTQSGPDESNPVNSEIAETYLFGAGGYDNLPFRCESDAGCGNIVRLHSHTAVRVEGEWLCSGCARDRVDPEHWDAEFGEYDRMIDQIQSDTSLAIEFVPSHGAVTHYAVWDNREEELRIVVEAMKDKSLPWMNDRASRHVLLSRLHDAVHGAEYMDDPQVINLKWEKYGDEIRESGYRY